MVKKESVTKLQRIRGKKGEDQIATRKNSVRKITLKIYQKFIEMQLQKIVSATGKS